MNLLCLPVEILVEIISLTLPDGIEAFALSCKTIYACAAIQIRRHGALRKSWASLYGTSPNLLFRLVGDAEVDPLAAQYVEKLIMRDSSGYPHEYTTYESTYIKTILAENKGIDDDVAARIYRDKLNRVKAATIESRYLRDANVNQDQFWETFVNVDLAAKDGWTNSGFSIYGVIPLLALLPNLKTMKPPMGRLDLTDEMRISILDVMVASSSERGGALTKLETIMPFEERGFESWASLQEVEPYFRCSALQELFLISCVAGSPFKWRFPNLDSPLRRIELSNCSIDASNISELLMHTPKLEIFKYSHEGKWQVCGSLWNPGSFVEAVGEHVGSTLTQLAITKDEDRSCVENGVSSFHSFSKLRILEVDVRIFRGPPLESGQAWGSGSSSPSDGLGEVEERWKEADLPSLASMLPGTITDVQINTYDWRHGISDEEAFKALLTGFEEHRQVRLPKLNKVAIGAPDIDAAQTILEAARARTDIYSIHKCPHRWDVGPGWKSEFDKRVDGALYG